MTRALAKTSLDIGPNASIFEDPLALHPPDAAVSRSSLATPGHKDSPEVTTILLTDDEAGVRVPLRRILEDSGFRVVEAAGGDEALAVAEGLHGPIHLLLTDVVMPGMSGGELARRMVESRPKMKVLFMSGYSSEAIATDGKLLEGSSFLSTVHCR